MLKKRNAQGLSITTIIVAVIGLIILIVLIAIFTGRIGSFSKGLDTAETDVKTCNTLCVVQGLSKSTASTIDTCRSANGRVLSGSTDVTSPAVCCCV